MSYGIKVRVWGEMALFSRPEMKVERCSYDIMTPSAARGILEAIYWHPGFRWVIDKIYVIKPIKFISIRRNEIKSKASAEIARRAMNGDSRSIAINTKQNIVQRASICLKDVEYVIEAHFEMTSKANASDNHGKFKDIMKRRLIRGECYHMPYFGCREFPVKFEFCEDKDIETTYHNEVKDLGYMLYDLDYTNPDEIEAMFFRAKLEHGILNLENCEVIR